ncbi:hypothetical protein EW145_g973 [Phellinidium pouzarii]|uniref:Guanine nucleotide-binding protein-like 1 n=1 Tax=Phellinidium pouzarii TaxID=167371 RepID=A0A4S4LGB6_9AGAM|nr:hypothetical protein EW145_g973 [Phellinidium pouzarii]
MPRRKPASAAQRKTQLQARRAIKRGDIPPPSGIARRRPSEINAKVQSSRRLQSAFVSLSPAFLEEAKHKASSLVLLRPLPWESALFPSGVQEESSLSTDRMTPKLTITKRPKWNHKMTKKQVESNEEGVFKKWLSETDNAIQAWKAQKPLQSSEEGMQVPISSSQAETDSADSEMPYSPPLYERNLEVWRQLWRVSEICQILLILLDSRCPPLHYPESLHSYISSFRTPHKTIFVLTKTDISSPERSFLWKQYLHSKYPDVRIVIVESYLEKKIKEGQGKRKNFEPQIPSALRRDLIDALKAAHEELCVPPPHIASHAQRLAAWKPNVISTVDWDPVLNAKDDDIQYYHFPPTHVPSGAEDASDNNDVIQDYISIGLIGQPNVGKSSLLNALFGKKKVKASKTPGKTKHFQTLFWTKQIRLVDCPGLVFPSYVDMELQVLAGVLPIAQIPAIPSSIYYALQHLPLERILGLQHPAKADSTAEDKRTWRKEMEPKVNSEPKWTAMDILMAYANKKGWITAKAGRPDINRAGNSLLRELADGRIRWAFYPPDADLSDSSSHNGVWIKQEDALNADTSSDELGYLDSDSSQSESEESEAFEEEEDDVDANVENVKAHSHRPSGAGMFFALALEDSAEDTE